MTDKIDTFGEFLCIMTNTYAIKVVHVIRDISIDIGLNIFNLCKVNTDNITEVTPRLGSLIFVNL